MHKAERPFGAFFHGEFEDNFDDDQQNDKFHDGHIFTNHQNDFMRVDDVQYVFFCRMKCKTLSHQSPAVPLRILNANKCLRVSLGVRGKKCSRS